MESALFSSIPAPAVVFVAVTALAGAATLLQLLVGVIQWARPTKHRIGGRWGAETIEVVEWRGGRGRVMAGGELWTAYGPQDLEPGERVVVARTEGLTLAVRRR